MLSLANNISSTQVVESKYSADFDGTNDYIDTNQTFQSVFRGDFSISFWVKPSDGRCSEMIFGVDNDSNDDGNSGGRAEVYFQLQGDGTPRFVFTANADVGVWYTSGGGGFAFSDGAQSSWTHFVVTMDLQSSGSSIGKIYVNGVDKSYEDADIPSSKHANYTSDLNLILGARSVEGTKLNHYDGGLDEFAIFNTVLDADAVTAIYNGGSSINLNFDQGNYDNSSDLQAYYRMGNGSFDDKVNGLVHDQSLSVIDSELVTNGGFSADSNWTKGTGYSISSGTASYDGSSTAYQRIRQGLTTEIGATYELKFTLSSLSSGGVNFGFADSSGDFTSIEGLSQKTYSSNGTHTRRQKALVSDHSVVIQNNSADQTFSIDDVSVKKVNNPGLDTDIVTNGSFSSNSDWILGTGYSISGGIVSYDGSGSNFGRIRQVLSTEIGATYELKFTLNNISTGEGHGVNFGFGSSGGSFSGLPQSTYSSDGTYTRYMVATVTDHAIVLQNNVDVQTFNADNISVRKVKGKPAITSGGVTFSSDAP